MTVSEALVLGSGEGRPFIAGTVKAESGHGRFKIVKSALAVPGLLRCDVLSRLCVGQAYLIMK